MSDLIRNEQHEYFNGNKRVPGVNEILKAEGFIKHFSSNDYALLRGEYVHYACDLLDKRTLDWDTLHPELRPFVLAYKKFIADYDLVFVDREIEPLLFSKAWNFAGSPDRLPIKIKGKETLIDLKTGAYYGYYELTTAAYQVLCEDNGYKVKQRWIVQLQDDGDYNIIPQEDKASRSVFLGACLSFNWKKEHLK